MQKLRKH